MKFEWDSAKAAENLRKHRVSFEDAATVFGDPFAATIPDPDRSTSEKRFVTIGHTVTQKLVVVAHTARADRVRVISARLPTRAEEKKYEEGS